MADFTQVKGTMWQDPEFEQLDAPAKLVWLNLLTTPTRNTAGLYRMSVARIAFETGLDSSSVQDSIAALRSMGWIAYDDPTGIVWIRKFIKRQPWSPTIRTKVLKDLETVGFDHPLVRECLTTYRDRFDTPSIPQERPIDTPSMGSARVEGEGEGEGDDTGTGTGTKKGKEEAARARPSAAADLLAFALRELPASQSTPEDYDRTLRRHTQRLPRSQIERIICELAEFQPRKPRDKLHLTLNKWLAKENPHEGRASPGRRATNVDRALAVVREVESNEVALEVLP